MNDLWVSESLSGKEGGGGSSRWDDGRRRRVGRKATFQEDTDGAVRGALGAVRVMLELEEMMCWGLLSNVLKSRLNSLACSIPYSVPRCWIGSQLLSSCPSTHPWYYSAPMFASAFSSHTDTRFVPICFLLIYKGFDLFGYSWLVGEAAYEINWCIVMNTEIDVLCDTVCESIDILCCSFQTVLQGCTGILWSLPHCSDTGWLHL